MTVGGTGGFRFTRRFSRTTQNPFRYKMGLAPGRYRLHAHTEQGFKADLEFDVKADSGSSPETIRVTLR